MRARVFYFAAGLSEAGKLDSESSNDIGLKSGSLENIDTQDVLGRRHCRDVPILLQSRQHPAL